jgi:hypothetical protein
MPLVPLDHNPNDPDDLTYNLPNRPSELTSLADEDLFQLLRKVAFANRWPFDSQVQFEATGRLIAALKDFKASSDRSGRILIYLTVVLIVLTVVLVVLTVAVLRHHG